MNKWIVVTTINRPTIAIEKIAKIVEEGDWRCVVVGDNKTPTDWSAPGIDYLGMERQREVFGRLAELIPENHYSRKNLGYLYAISQGATVILETDDDNIPYPSFGEKLCPDITGSVAGGAKWLNAYKHFTNDLIWPRGNPLDTIHNNGTLKPCEARYAPLQQYLADGDPDVDAIYRLVFTGQLFFEKRDPILLEEGTWCAFNSQNTLFFKDVFPLLYLPCHVSFRMTDIWRSFVAQLGLWSAGHQLAFCSATVLQERNEHDLMRDFKDEVDGYLMNDAITHRLHELLEDCRNQPLTQVARNGWLALREINVVHDIEIEIYDAWADACGALM